MNKVYKVAIVGGGASGLMSAVELLRGQNCIKGEDIVLLERLDRVGKKLIATGNGQGNLSNAKIEENFYHGDKDFIRDFINAEKEIDIENYLKDIGIPLVTDKEGRKYPISKQASAVLDVIRAYLLSGGVEIKTSFKVENIVKEKGLFKISSNGDKVFAKKVILACGGKAQKQFGTDGSSYILAQNFGHELTKTYPALVQLKTETEKIRGLKGLKEYAKVYAFDGDELLSSAEGDILFTEFGVSGNAIFKLSTYLVCAKNPSVKIEFLPSYSLLDVQELLRYRQNLPHIKNVGVLCGILNKKVGEAVIKTSSSNSCEDLAYALKNFRLLVRGSLGFDLAQVTKGGIKTNYIDSKTMQSKLVEGLFITGEMLDVDGDCGGYNLTFAFVSGIISAKFIKNSL